MQRKIYINFITLTLALCILLSSILSSYTSANKVRADEGVDVAYDIITVVMAVVGMIAAPEIEFPVFCLAVADAVKLGFDEYAFQTKDNGDGTCTISADLIQAIVDASIAENNGFNDSDIMLNVGNSSYDGSLNSYYYESSDYWGTSSLNLKSSYSEGSRIGACIQETKRSDYDSYTIFFFQSYNNFNEFTTAYGRGSRTLMQSGLNEPKKESNYCTSGESLGNTKQKFVYSCTVPVFSSQDELENFCKTGNGYKNAINYNPDKIPINYGSDFCPIYNGGDITINYNQLNNFTDYYIQVINNNKDKDIDDVLKILRNYIATDYELSLARYDNNILKVGENNTIAIEILNNIENFDSSFISWHGVGVDSVSYDGNIATLDLPSSLNEGSYNISAVYDNSDDIYIISPNMSIEVISASPPSEEESETETEVTDSLKETNSWLQKIYIRIGEFKKEVKQSLDNVMKELKKIRRWTALDTVFDGLDAVADWLDFVTKFFDDVGVGVSLLVEGFTETVTELTKVFPFSIPVTLKIIMDLLSAPPQVPKFELPLKIDHLGIDGKITIDLTEFGTVSVISRTFLTIIYCVGLYHLSFKIISAKKGG